jgi:hypothetical protein
MNNRLELNQQEKIKKWYHDHPLLCACLSAFQSFQAEMRYLMFSPTEVFVESVEVIDNILEDGSGKLEYIHDLWRELIIRYKLWPLVHQGVVDDKEYETAVSSVFYSVAAVMSRHRDNYYSETIKDALLAEIDSHTNVIKQEEDNVIVKLSQYADKLEQWLDEYDSSEFYLSEDIDDIAHDRKPRSSLKAVNKKINANRRKRTKNPESDYSRYSFRLNVIVKKLEILYVMLSKRDDKGKRLIDGELMKYNEVDEKILSNVNTIKDESIRNTVINKYLFNQVFSGQETDVCIVWTSDANKLWYFINTLYNYMVEIEREGGKEVVRLLEKSGSGPGLFEIVRSRFMNGKKRKVLDERTGTMVETSEPIEYEENAFNKYSKANSPHDTSVLDGIIDKIAPPRFMSDKEAIDEETDPWKYGIKTPKESVELDGNFHDTSHKGKYE